MSLRPEAEPDQAREDGSFTVAELTEGFRLNGWLVLPNEGRIEGPEGERHLEPLQVDLLLCLAARHERVVGKEEIHQIVWSGAEIEEGALARAVSELRKALGDDARQPRFIQTVPKRGYRLIVPPRPRGNGRAARPRRRTRWLLGAAALALVASFLLILRGSEPSPSGEPVSPAGPALAVLDFANLRGGAEADWLATGLAEMLSTELAASGALRVVPGPAVAELRRELADTGSDGTDPRSGEAVPSSEQLRWLRTTLGVDYVVFGSFRFSPAEGGEGLYLEVRLLDCRSGQTVLAVRQGGAANQVHHLAALAGRQLLSALDAEGAAGGSNEAVAALLPRDPAAARLYFEGLRRLRRQEAAAARELLQRSVDREPRQPFAWLALSEAYEALGEEVRAQAAAEQAHELSADLPREPKLWVEARWLATADRWNEAIEIYRALWVFSPENLEYGLHLARAENRAGRPRQALETLERLRRPAPEGHGDPRLDLVAGRSAQLLGEPAEALAAASRAAEAAGRLGAELLVARARLLQARSLHSLGRVAEAEAALEEARTAFAAAGDWRSEAQAQVTLASWLRDQGNSARADPLALTALEIFRQLGDRAGQAGVTLQLAGAAWERGEIKQAERAFEEAIETYRAIGSRVGEADALRSFAITLASHGRFERAEPLFEEVLMLHRAMESAEGEAVALMNIAKLMMLRGEAEGSARNLDQAEPLFRRLGLRQHLANTRFNRGYAAALLGEIAQAEAAFREAVDLHRQLENPRMEAASLGALGEILIDMGDFTEARQVLEQALALRLETGEARRVKRSRCLLAALALEEGDLETAGSEMERALATVATANDGLTQRLLARLLLAQGKPAEAQTALSRGAAELPSGPSFDRLWFELIQAQVHAANQAPDLAKAQLGRILEQTAAQSVWALHGEALLTLGEIELRWGESAAGRARLEALEAEARERGWRRLADRAQALLAGEATTTAVRKPRVGGAV